ncbi:unnamed protein product [Diatraea saccharalis]|uniref:C2H2-type domain-containing protein n=1 Tax=Diatraea saccharalis TaxID=40085 RepID=A0A9N9R0K2_9NEOP|nr:unnamed protein product [Diatraea saccharalis]
MTMASQCFMLNLNRNPSQNAIIRNETKPLVAKEKVMSYEEKSVGSTPFFKCEACPYMALAEDDIKFHLFTVHPDLAKRNGLAENIQIACPGCTSVFDAEETLRTHLRNHHKMGIKDVKKMVKSLVQIALKNAKLKKEDKINTDSPSIPLQQDLNDVKIPQVIEIVPDNNNANNDLPKGVAFISVDELNKMSTPNFEKVDPKEIIQEASINIVYTNEVSAQYVNVSKPGNSSSSCNMIQVSSITPDLISSIQPRTSNIENKNLSSPITLDSNEATTVPDRLLDDTSDKTSAVNKNTEIGTLCAIDGCHIRLKDNEKLAYHRKCHQNGKLICPKCTKACVNEEILHTHLWKIHSIDMELPTCEVCGFKTYKKYRLFNIHMKCHENGKSYVCPICTKRFKNANQLSKHKLIHKKVSKCSICQQEFSNERRLRLHVTAVHDKVKPFKCCHCDYTAARKEEMKRHLRSHTGDKPYSCDQCQYRSSDHNALRRHKKIHSNENLYKCKYCPYSAIQSTKFASHMISNHPNVSSNDLHRCPYCPFKTLSKDKYVVHLTTHPDKEGIQLLIEITKSKQNKPSWTIPSNTDAKNPSTDHVPSEQDNENNTTVSTIPLDVYDCYNLSETFNQSNADLQQSNFNPQEITDLSKDDNNSDCLISESSDDTLLERLQMTYENSQSNLHGFLNTTVPMEQTLLQSNSVNSLASSHSPMGNNCSNIMSNFPIRLPPAPQLSGRNNIMLKPVDRLSLPKMGGPIITTTQILPVPSSSSSPVNISMEPDGVPRKKPKISVKSNLILKGPDQENMFHSQQKMAFKRLEDNERFGLGRPMTFNNLITTQFMQLQPGPTLNDSPNTMMSYQQDTLLDAASTPVVNEINNTTQMFTFNQQMNVNTITLLPPSQKIQTNDPSYIKLEATIKQNTQSPSLERMCNANLLSTQAISREYKASPPLEDIHKNMNEIKNEVKSDSFYNIALNNAAANPPLIDQYLIDNIIGEQYSGHLDLPTTVLPEVSDDQQNDVIEIDDNSDDNKLLPRFDMNFPLESLYVMHNDFHFLENDVPTSSMSEMPVNEINRMVTEVPIINQKDTDIVTSESSNIEFQNFIQGKKDPMMNTCVRPCTNKINVKNIELMKN